MGWLFGSGLSGQCTTIDSPRISKRALFMGDFTCRCESPIRTLTPGNMASAASIKTVRKAAPTLASMPFRSLRISWCACTSCPSCLTARASSFFCGPVEAASLF